MKRYQTVLAMGLAINFVLTGCMRSIANPVPIAQIGDETKSCQSLSEEIQQVQILLNTSESDGHRQTAQNLVLGVTGAFLLVPWFFMDLGNAATVEKRAAQARLQRLQSTYANKQCRDSAGSLAHIEINKEAPTSK
ncbi:hypothetical protein [Mycoavidus sp. SF9855]|uniref:hypothetical protein n=1 Tax=Mycoavidus sp. SF9855 TaxID=2968475 RepID=UPI00211D1133|nr:hypothetical protein [Mycoavidus sp. SF9855]UUM21979.1 hypothetical protein NQD60_02455 [Mycoavidus sp. SF9855]